MKFFSLRRKVFIAELLPISITNFRAYDKWNIFTRVRPFSHTPLLSKTLGSAAVCSVRTPRPTSKTRWEGRPPRTSAGKRKTESPPKLPSQSCGILVACSFASAVQRTQSTCPLATLKTHQKLEMNWCLISLKTAWTCSAKTPAHLKRQGSPQTWTTSCAHKSLRQSEALWSTRASAARWWSGRAFGRGEI